MTITINSQPFEVEDNCTLQNAIRGLNLPEKGVAIAINNKMIQRSLWESCLLNDGDKVLIIKAVCGG